MMKKHIAKNLAALLALLMFLSAVSVLAAYATSGGDAEFSQVSFDDEYTLGTELAIPDSTVTVNEKSYALGKTLIFPDGTAKNTDKEVLIASGKYTVKYSATVSGKTYSDEYTFIVTDPLWSFEKKTATGVYDTEREAIALSLDGKNSFLYSDVLDLNDNTALYPFLELYNVASVDGERDYEQLMVVLTDLEDPTNRITVRINASDGFKANKYADYTSYVAVSVDGTSFKGKQNDGRIHVNNQYGRPISFSFCNICDYNVAPEQDRLMLFFDYAEKAIYAYGSADDDYGGIVADLDSSEFYNEKWQGFSRGRCRLSVYANQLSKNNVNVYITNIDGQDLTRPAYVDKTAPTLDIKEPAVKDRGLSGYYYDVFDFTAFDDNGVSEMFCKAYYNYYSESPIAVNIHDGKVKTDYVGVYTLCYYALDKYGNLAVRCVDFAVDDTATSPALSITVDGEYDSCLAGERVTVKPYTVSTDSRYGRYDVSVIASCGTTSVEVGDHFIPTAVGEWRVTYTAEDALGRTSSVTKTFNASQNNTPVFIDTVSGLPEYLITGNTYKVPALNAYLFGSEIETMSANVRYTLNGTAKEITDGTFTPIGANGANNTLTLTYYVDGAELSIEKQVIFIDSNALDMTKLFFGQNASFTADDDSILITAAEETILDYVNSLVAEGFAWSFSTSGAEGRATFRLIDSENAQQSVAFTFEWKNGSVFVYINGELLKSFDRSNFTVKTNGSKVIFNTSEFAISAYENGRAFTGFDSNLVAFKLSLEKNTAVDMISVSNQPLSDFDQDAISPKMVTTSTVTSYAEKGSVVLIPDAVSQDAVFGSCRVLLSVRVNGQYIKTTDGRTLNKLAIDSPAEVLFADYGVYYITYFTTDNNGNDYSMIRIVYVIDDIKPTVTVSGNVPTEVKVGESITLPSASATDNITEDLEVIVYSISPAGTYKIVKGTVSFDIAGKWTLRFASIDEAGNMAFVDRTVNVK